MNDKEVYIITGATGGMGKVLTEKLYRSGKSVLMACRNEERARNFIEELPSLSATPRPLVRHLDLASFDSVRNFVENIRKEGFRIKALVHNAGTLNQQCRITPDHFEQMTQVNYLSPYLLTRLLLPGMDQEGRIVCTSSCTWRLGNLQSDLFRQSLEHFHMFRTYGSSKLAILAFTAELAHRCRHTGITVNAVDPGVVDTPMITMHRWFDPLTNLFFRPFIKTAEEGAATTLYLTCSEEVKRENGTFWKNKRRQRMPRLLTQRDVCQQLWEKTEKQVAAYL